MLQKRDYSYKILPDMFVDLNDVMPRISFCAYPVPMFHLSECLPLSFMNHTSIKANKKSIKCLSESMGDATG